MLGRDMGVGPGKTELLIAPMILVTHDVDEAAALADRIAVTDHGQLLQVGPAADRLAAPPSDLVAELLGRRAPR